MALSQKPRKRKKQRPAMGRVKGEKIDLMRSFGPAGPCVSLITGEVIDPDITWPISVTVPNPRRDGTLLVLTFASRKEADAAGYQWVGRPSSALGTVGS